MWKFSFGVHSVRVLKTEALDIGAFSSRVFRAGPLNIGLFNILAGPVAPSMLYCRTPLGAPLRPQRDLGVHRHKGFCLERFSLGLRLAQKSQLWVELGSLTL